MSVEDSAQKLSRLVNKSYGATPQSVDSIVANKIAAVSQRAADKKALFSNTLEDKLQGLKEAIAFTEASNSPYSVPNSLEGFNTLFPNATDEDRENFYAIEREKVRVKAVKQHKEDLNSEGSFWGDTISTPFKAGVVQTGAGLLNLTDKYIKASSLIDTRPTSVGNALRLIDNASKDNAGEERRKTAVGISEVSENFREDEKPLDVVLQESVARIKDEGLTLKAKATALDMEIEKAEFNKTNTLPSNEDYKKRIAKNGANKVFPQWVAEHAKYIGKDFWDSLTRGVKNPTASLGMAIESLPVMIVSAVATKFGIPGVAAIGLMEGGSNAASVEFEILNASETELTEGSAPYRKLREKGFNHKDAQREIANKAGLLTFGVSSLTAMGSAKLFGTGELTESLFNPASKIGKNIITKSVEKIVRASLMEGGEELFQGATGTMAENFAKQVYTDKDQKVTENVGRAMAEGMLAGSIAGGGLTTIGEGVRTLPAIGKGVAKGAKAASNVAVKPLAEKGREVLKANTWKLDQINKNKDTEGYNRVTDVTNPDYNPEDAIYVVKNRDRKEYEDSPEETADHINELRKHIENNQADLAEEVLAGNVSSKRNTEIVNKMNAAERQLKMIESGQFLSGSNLEAAMKDLETLSPDKIDLVLGSGRQRDNIDIKELRRLKDNLNATEDQITEIENRIDSQKAEEKFLEETKGRKSTKSVAEVTTDELYGGKSVKGVPWKGLKQHLSAVSQAVRGTDITVAKNALKKMTDFLQSRVDKIKLVQDAFEAVKLAEKSMTGTQIKEDKNITAMLSAFGYEYTYFKDQENKPTGSNAIKTILDGLTITIETGKVFTKEAESLYNNKFSKAKKPTTSSVTGDVVPKAKRKVVVKKDNKIDKTDSFKDQLAAATGRKKDISIEEAMNNLLLTETRPEIIKELKSRLKKIKNKPKKKKKKKVVSSAEKNIENSLEGLDNVSEQADTKTEIRRAEIRKTGVSNLASVAIGSEDGDIGGAALGLEIEIRNVENGKDLGVIKTRLGQGMFRSAPIGLGIFGLIADTNTKEELAAVLKEIQKAVNTKASKKKAAAVKKKPILTKKEIADNKKAALAGLEKSNNKREEVENRIATHQTLKESKLNAKSEPDTEVDFYDEPVTIAGLPKDYIEVSKRENISLADMRDLDLEIATLHRNVSEAYEEAYKEHQLWEAGVSSNYDKAGALLKSASDLSSIVEKKALTLEALRKKTISVGKLNVTSHADTQDFANLLKSMLVEIGLDINLHVTSLADVKKRSRAADIKDSQKGVASTIANNNYVIGLKVEGKLLTVIETASHELGHILEYHLFNNLSVNEQAEIFEAYDKWLVKTNKISQMSEGSAKHFVRSTRPYFSAKSVTGNAALNNKEYHDYITSFSEWHADQVAKWATSTKAPQNKIEIYFKDVGMFFKDIYKGLRSIVGDKTYSYPEAMNYKADPTIQKYLDKAFAGNMDTALIKNANYKENRPSGFVAPKKDKASETLSGTETAVILSPLEKEKAKKGYKPFKLRNKLKSNLNKLRKIIDSDFNNISDLPEMKLPGSLAKLNIDGITEQAVEAIFNDVAARLKALEDATQQVANQALTGTFEGVVAEMYKVSSVLSSNYLRTFPNLFENLREKGSSISKKIYSELNKAETELLNVLLEFELDFKEGLLGSKNTNPVIDIKGNNKVEFFRKDIFKYFLKDTDGLNTPQEELLDSNTISQLALAGFTWFVSRGLHTINMPEEVMNLYVGKDKDAPVTEDMRLVLEKLGVLVGQTNYNIGQDFLKNMGLDPKDTMSEADQTRMEASIGDYVLAALAQMEIVEFKSLSTSDLNNLREEGDTRIENALDVTQQIDSETQELIDSNVNQKTQTYEKIRFVKVKTEIYYDTDLKNEVEVPVKNLAKLENQYDLGNNLFNITFGKNIKGSGAIFEEPKKVNSKIKNSEAKASEQQIESMDKKQKEAKGIRQDNLEVYNAFGRNENGISIGLATIGGYVSDVKNNVTLEEQGSVESKNNVILRDQRILDNLLALIKTKRKSDPKLYHALVMLSNGRQNNDTISVNEQSSKLHRRMMGTLNHRDIIQTDGSDAAVINRLLLAIANNLGISGNSTENVLLKIVDLAASIDNSTADPVFVDAIKAIQAMQSEKGGTFTKEQEAAVVAASIEGGEGFATFDALITFASYLTARKTESSFKTGMYRGADATNSGVAISIISLMTANDSSTNLEDMLEKTGIYFDETTDSLEWKHKLGKNDIYETVVLETSRQADSIEKDIDVVRESTNSLEDAKLKTIVDYVIEVFINKVKYKFQSESTKEFSKQDKSLFDKVLIEYIRRKLNININSLNTEDKRKFLFDDLAQITSGVNTIIGAFTTKKDSQESVKSIARNMFKSPIIASTYGAFLNSAARNFADKAIASFFSELTELMNESNSDIKTDRIAELEEALNKVIYPNRSKVLSLDIKNFKLTKFERNLLRNSILIAKGEALKEVLNGELGGIFKVRQEINKRGQEAVILFETIYNKEVELAMKKQEGKALTIQEKKKILKKLNYMMPIVETALGKKEEINTNSVGLNEGMPLFKLSDRELNQTDEYSTRLRVRKEKPLVNKVASIGGRGRTITLEPLGVAAGVTLNIQIDAAVMALVLSKFDALNLYDEIGLKLRDEEAGTTEINKTFIETMNSYDPLVAMGDALSRTFVGYVKYIADGKAQIIKDGGTKADSNAWAESINTILETALKKQKYIGKSDPKKLREIQKAIETFKSDAQVKAKARKILLSKVTNVLHYDSNSKGYQNTEQQNTEEDISALVDELINEEIRKARDAADKLGSSPASNNQEFEQFKNDSTYRDAIGKDAPDFITSLNTEEVFENLINIGHQKESAEHLEHLRYVVTNIIAPRMRKVGLSLQTKGKRTRGDAIPSIPRVYISNATGRPESKISMSVAGTYVHELGHLATYDQININDGGIQREFHTLFKYVQRLVKKGQIDYTAFLPDRNDTSDPIANEIAQERLDHIFANEEVIETRHTDVHSGEEFILKRNNFLHEFAMLGLLDENFRKTLKEFTPPQGKLIKGENFAEKFMNFFRELLRKFDQKLLNTGNLNAADKLQKIIEAMTNVENKNKSKLARNFEFFEAGSRLMKTALTKVIVQPLVTLASTRAVQQSKYALLSSAAKIISVAPTVKFKDFIEALRNTRRRMGASALGMTDSILRELTGPSPDMIAYHTMVSTVNKHVDQNGQTINNLVTIEMREAFLKKGFSIDQNHSVSRVYMRGDMSSLYLKYTNKEIEEFLNEDQVALEKEIKALENELLGITDGQENNGRIVDYYMLMARSLAGIMINGKAEAKVSSINAHNIANLNLTNKSIDPLIADTAEEVLNRIVSLEALKRVNNKDKANLKKVYEREYARKDINGEPLENGIDFIAAASIDLKKEAIGKNGVLRGQRALAVQGYVKDMFDADTSYRVGTAAEAAHYEKLHYERLTKPIPTDPLADETSNEIVEPLYIYINKDRRETAREAGAVTMRQEASKGTDIIEVSSQQGSMEPGMTGGIQGDAILNKNMDLVDEFFNGNDTLSLDGEANILVPITDGVGQISGWRYLMDEKTKRHMLNRDDEFGAMMASMTSSSQVNPVGTRLNSRIVSMILDTFQTATVKQAEHFVFIGEKSEDLNLRETWQRIPPTMRQELQNAFGEKGFYVHEELVEQLFGRKKKRISDWLEQYASEIETMEKEHRNAFAEMLLDNDGALAKLGITPGGFRKVGDAWSELVKLAKYTIVVKLGKVLLENVLSNTLVLATAGLSIPEIVKYNITAVTHSREYVKNTKIVLASERAISVKLKRIESGNLSRALKNNIEKDIKALRIKIIQSNEKMAISPVRELNEAGLYQTIVEEIDIEQKSGKYATIVSDYLKPGADKLGPLKAPVDEFFVNKTSATGNFFKIATQQSDFVARFAMHQHNMKRKKMSKKESFGHVKKLFVAYDTMTHGNLQWGNDVGLLMFSKYVLRIQGQIINLVINHPARVASLLLSAGYLDIRVPFITNSFALTGSLLHNVNLDPTNIALAPLANVYTTAASSVVFDDAVTDYALY
jgi:hypothetical protein